ncbi:MAG: hypothetical protein OXE46_04625 [Chloroflexi bacterium]|nr:hypothetical protein [Chloroflexota bacterium]
MTLTSALGALAAMRCEGIDDDRHYPIGQPAPTILVHPSIIWRYAHVEDAVLKPEIYDAQAGALVLGARLSLLVRSYQGIAQSDELANVSLWGDRLLAMLGADMFLGGSLTKPLSGQMARIGVVSHSARRYIGAQIDVILSVRIEVA